MNSRFILAIGACLLCMLGACRETSDPVVPPDSVSPDIFSFSPPSGPSGTTVVITGKGFGTVKDGISVTIGGYAVTVTSVETDKIIVVIPKGASTGAVTVSGSGKSDTSASPFTVMDDEFVHQRAITCRPGSCSPGSTFTILGQVFNTQPYKIDVRVGGVKARLTKVYTDSLIVIMPEALPAGPAKVTVTCDLWKDTAVGTIQVLPMSFLPYTEAEVKLENVLLTVRHTSSGPSPTDTVTSSYGWWNVMKCPMTGCVWRDGQMFGITVTESGPTGGEYWHDVTMELDTIRQHIKRMTCREKDKYEYSEGMRNSSSTDMLQSFSVYDVPYQIQSDGSLKCILTGMALTNVGFTMSYDHSSSSQSSTSPMITRQTKLLRFEIPPNASLAITLR